ncbi:hypothetical protein GCM10009575_029410 [Streptomyces rhizosphaericus]|uniref:Uncharacterized protein n=1 Tax=Streptomyces rhizosphaericus TaxID=114699 RepID=A0ABN1PHG9_9ACTN
MERDVDLEQRMPAHRADRGQLLHQPLERQILVVQCAQGCLPHPPQYLGEGRGTGQVGAHHQRVHEEPDQILQVLFGPPGDRAADRDVLPRAQLGQQHRHRGLPHHEHRHILPSRQLRQLGVQFGRQVEPHQSAVVIGCRGPRPVHRQGQFFRRPGQGLPPVCELPGPHTVRVVRLTQQLLLPQAVVGVLHRQRLPARLTPGAPRRIRL